MKVNRYISIFDKKTEKLLDEISVDNVPLDILRDIFRPQENDLFMIRPYDINEDQLTALNLHSGLHIHFDGMKNLYQLDCFNEAGE